MTHAGLDKEAFEAADPGFDERDEFVFVSGNHTTIETNVDPTLVLRCCDLQVQILDGCCGWDRIQRHIDERCDTAKGCCPCPGFKPFPLSPPAWFIQMYMCIDQPWHEDAGSVVFVGPTVGEPTAWKNLFIDSDDFTSDRVNDEGCRDKDAVD